MKKIFIIITTCIFLSNCSKLNFFGFGEKKDEFKKLQINKSLWIVSNELLNNYPNTKSNLKDGNISTDWIVLKKNPNVRFRISIYILGFKLDADNIEIFTEKEFNQNGIWNENRPTLKRQRYYIWTTDMISLSKC